MCQKYQLVDLSRARNFSSDGFNLMQKIKIKDHYAARVDCGAEYHIQVCLLDKDLKVLQHVRFDDRIEENTEGDWRTFEHVFNDVDFENVRYVFFFHGGKDTKNWAGHYGVKMTNSGVFLRCSWVARDEIEPMHLCVEK